MPNIVIVGSGFAGVYTYLHLHRRYHGLPGAPRITVISKRDHFLFTPLLHEVATGSVSPHNVIQPIRQIMDSCLDDFIVGEVAAIDTEQKIVRLAGNDKEIDYDYLVVAAGSVTKTFDFPPERVFALKGLRDALHLKRHMVQMFEQASGTADPGRRRQMLAFVVIGGGPTGVELAAEIQEFTYGTLLKAYPRIAREEVSIHLVHSKQELVEHFHPSLRKKSAEILRSHENLNVLLGVRVMDIGEEGVTLNDNSMIPTRTAILVSGVTPSPIVFMPEPKKDARGRIIVTPELNLPGIPHTFVIGDIAAIPWNGGSVPQTAQAAVQEAKTAARNLQALMSGQPPRPFRFRERGQLLSLGRWKAGARIGPLTFAGAFAWWAWRTIYASKMVGWSNRIRVVVDWTLDIFYPRDIGRW